MADRDDPFRDRTVVEHQVVLRESVDKVFGFVSDLTREPRWMTDVSEVRKVTHGPVREGARFWEVSLAKGARLERELTVTDYVPNRMIRVRAGSLRACDVEQFEFEPTEDGEGTKLSIRLGLRANDADAQRVKLAWDASRLAREIEREG